jgi:N-acetylmuramoyl-L-alanine amidase
LLASLALAGAGLCQAQTSSKVTEVRFWSVGEVTRVAIEVSGEFKYKTDHLHDPERLFFDIQGARPTMVSKGVHTIPVADGKIKQIRVAETQPGITRVVLDLETDLEVTASQLSNPERLMLELRSKDKTATPPKVSVSGSKTIDPGSGQGNGETTGSAAVIAEVKADPPRRTPEPPVVQAPVAKVAPLVSAAAVPTPIPVASSATSSVTPSAPPPTAAKRNSDGSRSLTRVLGLKLGRVVLDPGHGGKDVGTHGPSGLYEKDVVLDISKRLGALLEERMGSEVVLTRSDDTFIPLEERTQIANDHKADLFLSIHANSSPVKSVTGVETYYLNFTTSRAALDLAARENATSESSVFDLKEVLEKITLKDKIDESREFAARLQTSLYTISKQAKPTKDRGVKKAPFVVLIGAQMPSVLAEIGFLTNSSDEALMRKPEHLQKIAEALYKGIAAYADTLSHAVIAQRQ